MTIRKLNGEQVKVRDALLENQSVPAAARALGMKERRVRTVADQLVFLGQIRRDPTSKYPILYIPIRPVPLGTGSAESGNCRGCATPNQGGASGKRDLELSRVHLNGQIYYRVLKAGTMETLKDNSGYPIGDWTSQGKPTGSKEYSGFIRMENKHIKFFYREGGKGSKTFTVYPSDTHQTAPGAMAKGEAILRDRATYLTELLYKFGWRFHEQEVRGTFEAAHEDHPFVGRMDRKHVITDASVKADTSPGIPEAECTDEEANDILSFAPEHITQLYADDAAAAAISEERYAEIKAQLKEENEVRDLLITASQKDLQLMLTQNEMNGIIAKERQRDLTEAPIPSKRTDPYVEVMYR